MNKLTISLGLTIMSVRAIPLLGEEGIFLSYDVGNLWCTEEVVIAYGVNDLGMVVGVTGGMNECEEGNGFLWLNGFMIDLDETSSGPDLHSGHSISSDGSSVFGGGEGAEKVVVVRDGVAKAMNTPVGCEWNSYPEAMNDSATMGVGSCWDASGLYNGLATLYFLYEGSAVALPPPPGLEIGASAYAQDVNDSGIVIGYYDYPDGYLRAFIYKDGVMTQLINTLGGEPICIDGISNSGFVVGGAWTETSTCAMRYDMNTGEMICLGEGLALDVNDRGDAVGYDLGSSDNAVLYKDGQVIVLNSFLPDYMLVPTAYAINNYGWIVGEAYDYDFNYWGWLLVPIYEKGDYDGDEDVDLHDFGHFQECYAAEAYQGPEGGLHVGCSVFDFDEDVDLDGDDFAAFQGAFTGAITSGW